MNRLIRMFEGTSRVGSDWDAPQRQMPTSVRGERHRQGSAPIASSSWSDGIFDPVALLGWLMRNAIKIALIAGLLTAFGIGLVSLMSFPYRATAIVLADPREQRITLQEEVLASIGSDAAVLESMVQIVKSDAFLLQVMNDLQLLPPQAAGVSREQQAAELSKFRSRMNVERKGATYLVEISYNGTTGEEAARIANGIAEAFADSQNEFRSDATSNATRSLAAQLEQVRGRLQVAEEAVARFRADNGLVYVDGNNTLQMRQLAELNQQLALARTATEEARARYEEHRNGGALTRTGQGTDAEGAQLAFLRQQRAELLQARERQIQTYGPRHPRLVQTQQALEGVEREIARERSLVADQLKAELDIAASKQAQLEKQIAGLNSDVSLTDTARVQLDALEREAAANREIYQQLLNRSKATDQLSLLTTDTVRVVAPASVPVVSTRPSWNLVVPVLAFISICLATVLLVASNTNTLRKPAPTNSHPGAGQRAAQRPAQPRQPRPAPLGSLLGPGLRSRSERAPNRPMDDPYLRR